MRRIFFLVSLTISSSLSSLSLASGGLLGNGIDQRVAHMGAAWFVRGAVHYCMEVAADFDSVDPASAVDDSIKLWLDYIRDKRLAVGLSLDYRPMPRCDGNEDLRFVFGVRAPYVDQAKDMMALDNPVAFAFKESYDIRGRARGFIWISPGEINSRGVRIPDWQRVGALTAVLAHEMGHVLGVSHAWNTIMDDVNLASQLKRPHHGPGPDPLASLSIDHGHELIFSTDPTPMYEGRLGPFDTAPSAEEVFQLLTGRPPQGPIRARASVVWGSADLVVEDTQGTYTFPLRNLNVIGGHESASVFKRWYMGDDGAYRGGTRHHKLGIRSVGTLNIPGRSSPVNVEVERNSGDSRLAIYFIDGGQVFRLFTATVAG